MRKKITLWILEENPNDISMYKNTLDYLYHTVYFNRLDKFSQMASEVHKKLDSHSVINSNVPIPELIITDIRLQDGFFTELIAEKGMGSLPCPYVVASANDNLDLLRWCLKRGSLDFYFQAL